MVTVKFHGDLKRFEPSDAEIVLCVDNFRELMSGLLSQIQGLRQHLRQGYYKVRIGRDRYFSEAQIKSNAALPLDENCTVHFTPVVSGAGKYIPVAQVVAGLVLIGVGAFFVNPAVIAMGGSLALGGVLQMLARPPKMTAKLSYSNSSQAAHHLDSENKRQQSTSFSNLYNLTAQGRPIPLLYGKMMTSLVLISQGVESFDEQSH